MAVDVSCGGASGRWRAAERCGVDPRKHLPRAMGEGIVTASIGRLPLLLVDGTALVGVRAGPKAVARARGPA